MARHSLDESRPNDPQARPSLPAGQAERDSQARLEARLIESRRRACGLGPEDADPAVTVGLALSGGGIRSATFSLGLLQALARARILRRIDYVSTVSGGGYAGGFLGTLLRAPTRPPFILPTEPVRRGYELAELVLQGDAGKRELELEAEDLVQPAKTRVFHPLRWLREAGRYLAPTQSNDWLYAISYYLRSLTAMHFVGAVALVLAFCLWVWTLRLLGLYEVTANSPMWIVVAGVGFVTASIAVAYWATTQRRPEQGRPIWETVVGIGPLVLFALTGLLGAGLLGEEPDAGLVPLGTLLLSLGALCLFALLFLGLAWLGSPHVEFTRRKLTSSLSALLSWTLYLALFAGVDDFARWLYNEPGGTKSIYSAVLGFAVLLAGALRAFQPKQSKGLARTFRRYAGPIALVLALAICFGLATGYAMLVHATHDRGNWAASLPAPLGAPVAALLLALFVAIAFASLLLRPQFLNLSTLHNFYAARLTRAYLGGANFERLGDQEQGTLSKTAWVHQPQKRDLWTLADYYGLDESGVIRDPATACYPIHLVNVTLNEQRGGTSDVTQRDRKGVNVTVGPAGLAVERRFYAWNQGTRAAPSPVPPQEQGAAAFWDEPKHLLDAVRELKLGNWLAISGAAISSGVGAQTRLGLAMLATMFNVRLGYWWKAPSTLREKTQAGRPVRLWRDSTFGCLYAELTGGFWGRRGERWHLSDGGHFENTALYALIERRVGFIIASDNGADPRYEFQDWGNLVRKARIDFGAHVDVLEPCELDEVLPPELRRYFGCLADFSRPRERLAPDQRCAMLAQVSFDDSRDAPPLTILVLKPALIDQLPSDLLDYAKRNLGFPQESTSDQFYDEEQWESYRKLGELIGETILAQVAQQPDKWLARGNTEGLRRRCKPG